MNRRERDDLLHFLEAVLRTRATEKDFAADSLIREHCARQPDALYLLVQHAMALELALRAAQTQLAQGLPRAHAKATATAGETQTTTDQSGAWARGLLAQTGAIGAGVGLGAAAGIVAGGLLLDALDPGLIDDL